MNPNEISWEKGELYRAMDKPFISVSVPSNPYQFRPKFEQIKFYYEQNGIPLDLLFGRSCHTANNMQIYDNAIKNIDYTRDEYEKYLIKIIAKKLYLGSHEVLIAQSLHEFTLYFSKFLITEDDIITLVERAKDYNYTPRKKIVVFNPSVNLSDVFKQITQVKEIGKYNEKQVLNCEKSLTKKQISDKIGLSESTVKRVLNNNKKTTKGNKTKQKKASVQRWKKRHENGTQKECSKALKISLRSVKMYWNK